MQKKNTHTHTKSKDNFTSIYSLHSPIMDMMKRTLQIFFRRNCEKKKKRKTKEIKGRQILAKIWKFFMFVCIIYIIKTIEKVNESEKVLHFVDMLVKYYNERPFPMPFRCCLAFSIAMRYFSCVHVRCSSISMLLIFVLISRQIQRNL